MNHPPSDELADALSHAGLAESHSAITLGVINAATANTGPIRSLRYILCRATDCVKSRSLLAFVPRQRYFVMQSIPQLPARNLP